MAVKYVFVTGGVCFRTWERDYSRITRQAFESPRIYGDHAEIRPLHQY